MRNNSSKTHRCINSHQVTIHLTASKLDSLSNNITAMSNNNTAMATTSNRDTVQMEVKVVMLHPRDHLLKETTLNHPQELLPPLNKCTLLLLDLLLLLMSAVVRQLVQVVNLLLITIDHKTDLIVFLEGVYTPVLETLGYSVHSYPVKDTCSGYLGREEVEKITHTHHKKTGSSLDLIVRGYSHIKFSYTRQAKHNRKSRLS